MIMHAMNVLYLTNNAGRASTTVATKGWIQCLAPSGLRPIVASPIMGEFSDWLRQQGWPVFQQPLPFPDRRRPWEFAWAVWKLRRIVARYDVHLIHCNEQDTYPLGTYLARLSQRPIMVTVHCRMEPGFGQWAFGGWRRPHRIVFLTHASLDVCRPAVEGIVPEAAWRVIPNAIDLKRFATDPLAAKRFREQYGLEGKTLIGAGTWLRPGKQIEHLVEVVSRITHHSATLVLAGGIVRGEEDYAREVLKLAEIKLKERFCYLGCIDDLVGMYNALNLYINTSIAETCSISIMESLACGCPVVGYPSVSVSEQVLPDGGQIVPQNDIDALATAVREWLTDRQRLAAARPLARRQAQRFDIAQISQELWKEYQDVLAEHRASRRSRCSLAGRG